MKQSHSCIDGRHMRIFLSSTFQDMDAEREYLVKKVFPQLKEEAARRFVSVTELDLRWGITSEESRSGRVLEICLDEIDNSKPFFIGLVGNRYGWCPSVEDFLSDKALLDKYPQVADYLQRGLSITEMEMQYAILGNADPSCNALFLLKASDETYELLEEDSDADKLHRLRTAIRQSVEVQGEACREVLEYHTLEELGEAVRRFFGQLLDCYFPASASSVHERTLNAQRALLQQLVEDFVPLFTEISQALSDWVASGTSVNLCLLTGERGCGKSAFLAHWVEECSWHGGTPILYYMAEGGQCTSLDQLLRHFAVALAKLWNYEYSLVTVNPTEAVRTMLEEHAGDALPVVVLDGLDAMLWLDEPGIHRLLKLFGTCRVVFSFAEDYRYRMVLDEYPVHALSLPSLSLPEQEYFIAGYLSQYGKRLSPSQVALLVDEEKPMNLFRLHLILEELRLYGSYEHLDEYIRYLVSFRTDEQLMDAILNRYAKTFGREMVVKAVCSLYVTLHGLTEDEVCELLQIRPLDWSAFYCAFKQHFVVSGGLLTIRTVAIRTLILNSYSHEMLRALKSLISLFRKQNTSRAYQELCYLYRVTRDAESLYALLSDYAVFESCYNRSPEELADDWQWLCERDARKYSPDIYNDVVHIKEVNRQKRVDHDKVYRFLTTFFPKKKRLVWEELKHAEWNRNPMGVMMSVMDDHSMLSIPFLLEWGRQEATPEAALTHWEAATELYESTDLDAEVAFEAYLEQAAAYAGLYRYKLAARSYDGALNLIGRHFPEDKSLFSRAMTAAACFFAREGEREKAFGMIQQAYDGTDETIPQERLEAGMAWLEIASMQEPSLDRSSLRQKADELLWMVKCQWGRQSQEYARLLLAFARMYICLEEYGDAWRHRWQAVRLLKEKHGQEVAPWRLEDFLDSHSHTAYKLGCYYSRQEGEAKDVAAAYFWLQKAHEQKVSEALFDSSLWQSVCEARMEEIRRFESEGMYREEAYLCRLIFPSAHEPLCDEAMKQQMQDECEACNCRLAVAWRNVCMKVSSLGLSLRDESMPQLVRRVGATRAFCYMKVTLLRSWCLLKQQYPNWLHEVTLMNEAGVVNDDGILTLAESAIDKKLQRLLVYLVELSIELEGWEIANNEICLTRERKRIEEAMKCK